MIPLTVITIIYLFHSVPQNNIGIQRNRYETYYKNSKSNAVVQIDCIW